MAEATPFIVGHTNRGFAIVEFTDRYGAACKLQKSSLATEDAIWLGVTDDKRMHLTREMVADLLPILTLFVETGEISPSQEPDHG